ncbi:hypothetical protein HPB47_021494, partial [Ixodes persulcatus]
ARRHQLSITVVVLAATKSGVIPLTVLLHNCQGTASYSRAFNFFENIYQFCFGEAHWGWQAHGTPAISKYALLYARSSRLINHR